MTTVILLVLATVDPRRVPKGEIPRSAPTKKIDMPIIINKAPNKNRYINIGSIGEMVKFNITTNKVIGKTVKETSFNF